MLDARAELGECPVWSVAGAGALLGRHPRPRPAPARPGDRARPATWPMPSRIGSFGLRESAGGAVVALVDGFHLLDFDTGELTFLAGPEQVPGTRFNDGKVSPGRPVLGRHDGRGAAVAADRRAVPAGPRRAACTAVVDGLIVSNGLALERRRARRCSTPTARRQVIWAYDYDPGTGAIVEPPGGRPADRGGRAARTAPRSTRRATTGAPGISAGCSTGGRRTAGWTARSRCPARTRPRPASAGRT